VPRNADPITRSLTVADRPGKYLSRSGALRDCIKVENPNGPGVMSATEGRVVMEEHPKAPWFRGRALESVRLALSATDARIKRLHAAEAGRWLRLAQLKRRTEMPAGSRTNVNPRPPAARA
jgi:hypothetical protein